MATYDSDVSTVLEMDAGASETNLDRFLIDDPHVYLSRVHKQSNEQQCTLLTMTHLESHFDFLAQVLERYTLDLDRLCDKSFRLLVEHGTQVTQTTRTKLTPLHGAC